MTHSSSVYPHHDLLNLAFYNYENAKLNFEDSNKEGAGLDCMNCLIALGLGVEGLINFAGSKLYEPWHERDAHHMKLKRVCEALNLEFDETNEPLFTLKQLKKIRDTFAHPKPIERNGVVSNRAELGELMRADWDEFLTLEYIQHAYDQVTKFENIIYKNPTIESSDIFTTASGL